MSVKETMDLKKLEVRLNEINQEIDHLKHDKREAESKLQEANKRKFQIEKSLKALRQKFETPIVSEHAMLRYFERVLGFDLEEIKGDILSEEVLGYLEELNGIKNGKIPNNKNENKPFHVVLRNGVVTTVE